MESATEAELARLALGSDECAVSALEELCRRLAPRARLYAMRHLRDAQAANDLAQEALLIFLESMRERRVQDPDRVGHFLLGICRNVLWNGRREEARRQRILERFGPDLVAACEDPIVPDVDASALEECLAKRTQRERQVLLLTFLHECDVDAIAARMDLSGGNVRVIRHRALRALRGCLDGTYDGSGRPREGETNDA